MSKNQWVVIHHGQWAVRGEGNEKVTSVHSTQADAAEAARQIAMNQKSELIVQGEDGKIQYRNSYGGDPFPPQG